jgi:Rrf2 family protein
MRLSTKGRFAVTAMIDVALREKLGPVPLSDIAARQQISLSYLEQMFSRLRSQGLVTSTRGPGGGYTLGQRTDAITVADIIAAVEDAPAKNQGRRVAARAGHGARPVGCDERQGAGFHAVGHVALLGAGAVGQGREDRAKTRAQPWRFQKTRFANGAHHGAQFGVCAGSVAAGTQLKKCEAHR